MGKRCLLSLEPPSGAATEAGLGLSIGPWSLDQLHSGQENQGERPLNLKSTPPWAACEAGRWA